MKNKLLVVLLLSCCFGCKKGSKSAPSYNFNGTVVAYAPVPVAKTTTKKVFAHLLPWFETPQTNTLNPGNWGAHWTMNLGGSYPNTLVNGQRRIASYYNPLIGPYASGDTAVIDYQLLLMKLSGIDGVFIDWPGTGTNTGQNLDLPMAKHNTDIIVSRLAKVGLKYAIVYEDNDLSAIVDSNVVAHAQTDMNYLQSNYFNDPDYEKMATQPLLLDFGPQAPSFNQVADTSKWTSIFSILTPKPAFITLSSHSQLAGANATGEFVWVYANAISSLNSFYGNGYGGTKIAAAFPGFNSYYQAGGGSGPGPLLSGTPAPTVAFFEQTLDLALNQNNINYLQLVTWNDYGEGTIIEPTVQFGYGYLTTLQSDLQVSSSLSQADLEAVAQLYQLRQNSVGNPAALAKLDQGFYFMASLQMDSAKALLASF
jgi:hypothetical protein